MEYRKGTAQLHHLWISPRTGKALSPDSSGERLSNNEEAYFRKENVWVFLENQHEAYEGAYLNKVKYVPRLDTFPFTIPLWMMVHGYVWEVRQQFPPGALLCELGCASGVNYFGKRFSMIGLDYSWSSLRAIEQYLERIQADAVRLPFADQSLDGIISSFFWEHISPGDKEIMLKEFHRVLKPGGKVVMLYDVETQNRFIGLLKRDDLRAYHRLFLEGDYHIGYETPEENEKKFETADFHVLKHFGLERTFLQSNSVYVKLSNIPRWYGRLSTWMCWLTVSGIRGYLHMLVLRIVDITIGRFFDERKSRIFISVLKK